MLSWDEFEKEPATSIAAPIIEASAKKIGSQHAAQAPVQAPVQTPAAPAMEEATAAGAIAEPEATCWSIG